MNRIESLFSKRSGPAFLAFLTAGDPDLATTSILARRIDESARELGVPLLLEIGFPYSDPIADGPTIQSSYTRALGRKVRVGTILEMIGELRQAIACPIVGMVSYSLVFARQTERFLADARRAGLDGLIMPDLPLEEAAALHDSAKAVGLCLIPLIAPTTPPARAAAILRHATGFVYYVSVAGITGERKELPPDLVRRIEQVRGQSPLPVCVGFGISRPEQVATLRPHVDGIIVGSAIVQRAGLLTPGDASGTDAVVQFVEDLMRPLSPAS